ncbi:hypothetical protein L5515_008517 [Caenorhabditis briggsae]|uniref:Protein kinase domain-containing protein n=1 Tax=Caenorhabditis briggsae TaxID=6238 RepID=A0AAE9F1L9_CAEBR|nr:hypothetical protein L5515_008517 [Caenorhabditis briggsae]
MAPLFPDFRKIRKRMKRSLNFGSKQPAALNYPLTQLVVDYFDKKSTFDYLEPHTSAMISKNGFANPCTLVVALVYLDRLRDQNKEYFEATDPVSLYVPALVLASKYIHDTDTYDRVSNSEWAESLKMNFDELNSKEWQLVKKLDWNVAVKNEEFEKYLEKMEKWVAGSFVEKNDFMTYNELLQLSSMIPIIDIVKQLIEFISSTSLIYCLTLALMSATMSTVSEPSTSTDVSVSRDTNRTFSPVFLSPRTPSEPTNDFTFEFSEHKWNIEEDVEFEKENGTEAESGDGCVVPMLSHKIARLLLLLVLCFLSHLLCAGFCATDGHGGSPTNGNQYYFCNADNFTKQLEPPVKNDSTTGNYCDVVFLLDLDSTYTSEENYTQVIEFISDTTDTCMNRGIGYNVFAYPMWNESLTTKCCDPQQCRVSFGFMKYADYVGHYTSLDPIQPVTSQYNFSYVLIDDLKNIGGNTKDACLYNNYVLITNRIFDIRQQPIVIDEISKIENVGCLTLTVIVVGNDQITTKDMYDYYQTTLNYVVPNFNCLYLLKDCIKPCGSKGSNECFQLALSTCANPTTPEPTTVATTPTTPSTPEPTPNASFLNDWQITYLFAVTNATTDEEFNRLVNYISDPLQECNGKSMIIRFLARDNMNSGWMNDLNHAGDYLQKLKPEEVLIGTGPLTDRASLLPGMDNITFDLVYEAVSRPPKYNEGVSVPRVVLLTDFVSKSFLDNYNTSLLPLLEYYDFNIIAFTNDSYYQYKTKLSIKSKQITNDAGYEDSNELKLCKSKEGANVTTIMFIIIGTCSGAMFILILLTVLYRQKYMWMRKLKKFKTSHTHDSIDDQMIDYWELSWEKLVVKNEKLGHGAYGHVFKGKINGIPPAIDKFLTAEALDFTDCDCAVKMLPKYATESAKQEFRHEIELMKNLGFNEHIVNMLGCITISTKSCLVLEYCCHRDLLRYVKNKKCDLEISRSVDDTIDSHKEFLNFAWQITQGMRFLVDKKIIHRDLAARNVLITEQCGMKSAKVSDFGLAISCEPSENGNEVTGSDRLPIKWLALESLEKAEFSHKSDVWSFGIVIFEMYSLGEVPFAEIEPTELIAHLKTGARPKTPLLATDKIEEIMTSCWEEKPLKRPEFDELSSILATQLEQTTEGYGYLQLIRTRDYRVVAEIKGPTEEQNKSTDEPICIDDHPPYVTRNRSVTWRSKPNGEAKLGREYSLTTHVCEDETSQKQVPNGTPKLPTTTEPHENNKKDKKKSYLNLPNLLPSLNSINPFSKDNEFKKTFKKKKFYSRRGSVPY